MNKVTYYAVICNKENRLSTLHIFDKPEDACRACNLLNGLFKDRFYTALEGNSILTDAMLVKHKQALIASKEALQDLNEKAKVFKGGK